MNGNFWGHLVKAIGYAVLEGGEGESEAPVRATRRNAIGSYAGPARKKGCCNAKRPAVSEPSNPAPAEGAQFSGVRPVRTPGGK